ncbi:MAG: hypothetical protein NVS1B2_26230 [Vulcanimicrobiaceae bacterium]
MQTMTVEELQPFVGRLVALRTSTSEIAVTGKLERAQSGVDSSAFHLVSIDDEHPPVALDATEIVAIEG